MQYSLRQWPLLVIFAVAGEPMLAAKAALAQSLATKAISSTIPYANDSARGRLAATPLSQRQVALMARPATRRVAQADIIEITNVRIEDTLEGVTIQLETDGELAVPEPSTTGNAVIADIANAVLQLPGGDEFSASNPAEGIALVTVTSLPDNQVRLAITGTEAPPAVTLSRGATGLIATVTPGTPTAAAPEDDAIQIVVTGEEGSDYYVPDASTATRTDTPLRDIPQSIQVIPRQVIEDQQATGLEDVVENAAGVTFLGNDDGRDFNVAIRGFDNVPVLRDGFQRFGRAAVAPEVANLERVEVLRGPASILFGQAEPGGLINLVTKQPLSEPVYDLQFQVGNRAFISSSIDLSGPLTDDGRLLYRLNALYRGEGSFREFDNDFDRYFIAPTLTWQISDRSELTVNLEYIDENTPADFGTVAFGDSIADIPLERVTNNPDDTIEKDYLNVGYTLEHRFSDNWQLRHQFRFISDQFEFDVLALPAFLDESTGILTRLFASQFETDDTYSLYTNVQGNFNTGPVEHTLLFGVDWTRIEREEATRFAFNPAFFSPIDIFDPDYSAVPTPAVDDIPIASGSDISTDQIGIYLQDQIDILDNLIVLAGLRYDIVDRDTTSILDGSDTNQYDDALTPRLGVVYQPIDPISLYASYSQSFVPNSATDAQGQPLAPEEGEGFEVGVKADIIENRLAATLAYFNITSRM